MSNHCGDGNYLVINNTSSSVSINGQTVPPHGSLAVSELTDQIRQAAAQGTIGIKNNTQHGHVPTPATDPATGTNQLAEIQRLDTLATSLGNILGRFDSLLTRVVDIYNAIVALMSIQFFTTVITRQTSSYTVPANFRSLTVTTFSNDVTINGVSLPSNFTWSVSASQREAFGASIELTGSDYLVTEVR